MNVSGIDPEVAAADFSSLPLEQKHELVTELIRISRSYRRGHVQSSRLENKQFKWCPYLHMKELMMIGDLDPEEAKKSLKELYHSESFEGRLELHKIQQLEEGLDIEPEKYAPDYNEEIFADTKFKESDYHDENETRPKLDAQERKNMLANVESWRKKIKWGMENRKKTEFNQSDDDDDDGACSETREEAKQRKDMLVNIVTYRMKIQRAMKNRMMRKKTEF